MTDTKRHLGYSLNPYYEAINEQRRLVADAFATRLYERFANTVLFAMRVQYIVGYNPQRLLPAPTFKRDYMQMLSEWAAEQIKMPYTEFANSVFKTLVDYGEVTFNPNELDVSVDYSEIERQTLFYMHATFIHESQLGGYKPRGRIELFDYDDSTVINLEGSGELHGYDTLLMGEQAYEMLFKSAEFEPKKPIVKQNGRSASYLDHDPTKSHRRRRR